MSNDNVNGKVKGDLVSRTEAIDVVRSMTISLGGKEIFHPEAKKSVMSAIDELPAVDAVPVVHGRWIEVRNKHSEKVGEKCSVCGRRVRNCGENYCPNCGAIMDGD